jgi:hypothetical protein
VSHFKAIRALVEANKKEIEAGLGSGGVRATAVTKAMLEFFAGNGEGPLDPDAAAATLLLLSWGSLEVFELVPRHWLNEHGAAFAVDAMCRTLDFGRSSSHRPASALILFEAKDAAVHLRPWEVSRLADQWVSSAAKSFRVLREISTDEGARTIAEQRRATAPRALRCALSFVFAPDAPRWSAWAREDALACSKEKISEPYYVTYMSWLFAALDDGDVAEALARVAPVDVDSSYLDALAKRLGGAAVPALAELVLRKANALDALLSIKTPTAAVALLPSLAVKGHQKRVLAYYTEQSELALAALTPVATGGTKLAPAARVALAAVAEAHPNALDHETRAAVFGVRTSVASASDVPAVLAAAPWLSAAVKKTKTPPVAVSPAVVPITADWKPGERDEWDAYGNDNHIAYHREHNKLPDWETKIDEDEAVKASWGGRPIDFALMHIGPEALALRVWNELRDNRRTYYPNKWYGMSILASVARRGAAFVPGLLELLKLKPAGADRMPIEEIVRVLVGFDGTAIAETLLEPYGSGKKVDAAALTWAKRRPETMCLVAIPRALSGSKPAIALLRALIVAGYGETIQAVAQRYKAIDAVHEIVPADPLLLFPPKLPKLPPFVRPDALPPVVLRSGAALPSEAVTNLCMMLAFSTLEAPYAGIAHVRKAVTEASLRDFALALFDAWLAEGAPPKEAWVMTALGLFGDDAVVRRLVPLVRAWPGDGLSARAVQGLGALEAIGTDLALSSIDGIAQKTKFASIKSAAQTRIAAIAERRGLSPEDLSDRLVPDLGLDERGTLALGDYRVVLDEQLEAHLETADGTRMKALPKTEKAHATTLKALKKDLKAVASQRITRLERLMVSERTFSPDEIRLLFANHPLMRQLARRLVWASGNVTFRIDESAAFVGLRDEPVVLAADARVLVVHPLALDDATKTAWGQVFADYELLQPFPQLARETYGKEDLGRVIGTKLTAPKLVFGLERAGWERDGAEDGGSFNGHTRAFSAEVTARVAYDGAVGMGYIEDKELLTIRSLDFTVKGPGRIIVSETLRDLLSL